jgi:hypothetical protein
MAEQGTEAKVLTKDEERKLRLQQERFEKELQVKWQRERDALKKDVEMLELWIKYYQYRLALPGIEQQFREMEEKMRHNDIKIEKNPADMAEESEQESDGTEVEETPIVKLKKE